MEREALKLALDALENHCGNYKLDDAGCDRHDKAITAIKAALDAFGPDEGISLDQKAWNDSTLCNG